MAKCSPSADCCRQHVAVINGLSIKQPRPLNTKHLYNMSTMLEQHRRRWADVVQMLYKYFVCRAVLLSFQVLWC